MEFVRILLTLVTETKSQSEKVKNQEKNRERGYRGNYLPISELMGGRLIAEKKDSLVVIWTSGDKELALKMVFMYTLNAKLKGWWDNICLMVWGPSQELLTKDVQLQEHIKKMKEAGIVVEACKACSDQYGVSEKLEEIGVEVKYVGMPLTTYIKEGRQILTF